MGRVFYLRHGQSSGRKMKVEVYIQESVILGNLKMAIRMDTELSIGN